MTARKNMLDAIPRLLSSCRAVSEECAGGEAVFAVLGRADEWIENDWVEIQQQQQQCQIINSTANQNKCNQEAREKCLVLGRRLIYSHHIIANSKRKAIADLASQYNLGGYAKIGWPGIIIVEGNEEDCISYVDEIRTFRWQYLTVRGEEQEEIVTKNNESGNASSLTELLNKQRKLPMKFEELDQDQMSTLAGLCRDAGLENLFLTSMKIYRNDATDNDGDSPQRGQGQEEEEDKANDRDGKESQQRYGALIHVDHMNNAKKYKKNIERMCKEAECFLFVKRCFLGNDDTTAAATSPDGVSSNNRRPIILVGLVGTNKSSVKKVLKRWRTSTVDVDSRGKSCVERMMTILEEGTLETYGPSSYIENDDNLGVVYGKDDEKGSDSGGGGDTVSMDKMKDLLCQLGGTIWSDSFVRLISRF
uniref:Small nuclear ribonucleoprotein Prp3 C-terminal domain-containing protein n=1 Tax=Ditylum brightwellii TaxID=49249 RepID=A0A7S1YPA5_9STRA|mmetsp:Transcript_11386/g.16970  ORF Transcript_11386/g.16970 Transcript_11386/m.16970 type:complete len:420 (+) Transcript_11386:2-1261(+)